VQRAILCQHRIAPASSLLCGVALNELSDGFKQIGEAIKDEKSPAQSGWNAKKSWTDIFNDCLEDLYDLGDTVVKYGNGISDENHFIWVG
jgi:hypothetical protein